MRLSVSQPVLLGGLLTTALLLSSVAAVNPATEGEVASTSSERPASAASQGSTTLGRPGGLGLDSLQLEHRPRA